MQTQGVVQIEGERVVEGLEIEKRSGARSAGVDCFQL